MRSRILGKIMIVITIVYLVMSAFYSVSALSLSEMEEKANKFIEKGAEKQGDIKYNNVVSEFSDLGQILTLIGTGVLVIVTTYMGIKYLTAGPEAQAKLKVQLVGLLVSAVVVFCGFHIWKFVLEIVSYF